MLKKNVISRFSVLSVFVMLALSAVACTGPSGKGASADGASAPAAPGPATAATVARIAPQAGGDSDPIEPVNRAIFGFNNLLDAVIIGPAARVYTAVLPGFVRDGIRNFMRNLKSPLIVGNEILQGDIGGAGVATARFVINTTAGVGGLVDVAATQGLTYASEDFGQTLGVWGAGDGVYLVLPLFGPSTLRDATGDVADSFADPLRIWSFKTGRDWIYYTRNGVEGLDNRARLTKAMDDLRRNNLDYYAAVRSAYIQQRRAEVSDRRPGSAMQIPDYDEKQ